MSSERWVPVLGWEGYYEVSDHGRVRSMPRVVQRATTAMKVSGRVLKMPVGSNGYPHVGFSRGGVISARNVHSLVLEAFVGPRPPKMEALHNNGIRTDCRLENLRWGTSAENSADMIRHGTAWRGGSKRKSVETKVATP